jgi:CBS domain-containing protein
MAHRIIGGSDFCLMPSRFEPCGLTQMQAQLYGTLPIAHATGGLADTIEDGITGFLFPQVSAEALFAACRRALAVFSDKSHLSEMRRAAMARRFGWATAAAAYEQLYSRLSGKTVLRSALPATTPRDRNYRIARGPGPAGKSRGPLMGLTISSYCFGGTLCENTRRGEREDCPTRASDIMTRGVITVTPETTVHELAQLLSERSVSGVPVVDAANRVLGIVSEGDLLHRTETGTECRTAGRRARWFDALASEQALARAYIKSHGMRVADIMTRNVISVEETTPLDEVANLLETHRIKRVPVIRDGQLTGIISRANLVRVLAATKSEPPSSTEIDDRTIRGKLLAQLEGQKWVQIWSVEIIVKDQVVHFWLSDDIPEAERDALRVAAETILEVRGVQEHLVSARVVPPI